MTDGVAKKMNQWVADFLGYRPVELSILALDYQLLLRGGIPQELFNAMVKDAIAIPLHAGAEKYYREAGLIK